MAVPCANKQLILQTKNTHCSTLHAPPPLLWTSSPTISHYKKFRPSTQCKTIASHGHGNLFHHLMALPPIAGKPFPPLFPIDLHYGPVTPVLRAFTLCNFFLSNPSATCRLYAFGQTPWPSVLHSFHCVPLPTTKLFQAFSPGTVCPLTTFARTHDPNCHPPWIFEQSRLVTPTDRCDQDPLPWSVCLFSRNFSGVILTGFVAQPGLSVP